NSLDHSGINLPHLRSPAGHSPGLEHVPAGSHRRVSGFLRLDSSGICHRLAHGFDASLPRHYQSLSHSVVASLWGAVPALRRIGLVARADADQPVDLWSGSATAVVLSGHGWRVISGGSNGSPGVVLIFHVRARVSDGQPADHEAGS